MSDLRRRFGNLVAAQRRRAGLSRAELASRADLSLDMLTKVERGATGASFDSIERLAGALEVDPSVLFGLAEAGGGREAALLQSLVAELARLDERRLAWVAEIISVALRAP